MKSPSSDIVGVPDPVNDEVAQTQLVNLSEEIDTTVSGLGIAIPLGTQTEPYTFYPGTNYVGSNIYFDGVPLVFDGSGVVNGQFFISSSQFIVFNNVPSITLINTTAANIFCRALTAIRFTGTTLPPVIPGVFIAGGQISFSLASNVTGRLYANTSNITFRGGSVNGELYDNGGPRPPNPCYMKGTLISTKRGFVPIETIKAGDLVVTKGRIRNNRSVDPAAEAKFKPVTWISKFKVAELTSESRPICIRREALGPNTPFQDLYVSPNHSLLVDGAMVMAEQMVNGTTIFQDTECDRVTYYHLECENHSAIIANGVLAESYLEVNNRHVFETCVRVRHELDKKKIYALQ
jgi:hypothetical protein